MVYKHMRFCISPMRLCASSSNQLQIDSQLVKNLKDIFENQSKRRNQGLKYIWRGCCTHQREVQLDKINLESVILTEYSCNSKSLFGHSKLLNAFKESFIMKIHRLKFNLKELKETTHKIRARTPSCHTKPS